MEQESSFFQKIHEARDHAPVQCRRIALCVAWDLLMVFDLCVTNYAFEKENVMMAFWLFVMISIYGLFQVGNIQNVDREVEIFAQRLASLDEKERKDFVKRFSEKSSFRQSLKRAMERVRKEKKDETQLVE